MSLHESQFYMFDDVRSDVTIFTALGATTMARRPPPMAKDTALRQR